MQHLNAFQRGILEECLKKQNGGMSLPMGSGKTLLSIILGLEQTKDTKLPILVVVSKTLLESWIFEIKKFFEKDELKYEIMHQDYHSKFDNFKMKEDTRLIITTADVISKYYKKNDIERRFVTHDIVNEGKFNQHQIIRYNVPEEPFSTIRNGPSMLFSITWGSLIVDEIQKFTKVSSLRCRGLAAICAIYRWGLSGTMFDEPKIDRILGYHIIINVKGFPRTLPETEKYVRNMAFRGINRTLVTRSVNDAFVSPIVNEKIINHKLTKEEQLIYLSMKTTMKEINNIVKQFKIERDTQGARRFSSYLLALITYLRQSIVFPLLPLATVALDVMDYEEKSKLSSMILKNINEQELEEWLNNPDSVMSSRMRSVVSVLDQHEDERLVVFVCFRTCLDNFMKQLGDMRDRPLYTLSSTQSTKARAKTLKEYSETDNGILFLTYELGAEGLNLQTSHTILLVDMWWNSGKTQQSIARVLRQGQTSEVVNVYYFTSNTGIERAIFNKHEDKLTVLNELKEGPLVSKIRNMSVKDIIEILNNEDNKHKLNALLTRL